MKTTINPKSLLQALEYTSKNYFSKPYSISPIVDRWFNQLAVVQLDNGKTLHISGKTASKYVDITVDDIKISLKDLALVHRFHSQHATHEKDKTEIEDRVKTLELELQDQEPSKENESQREELLKHKESLEQYSLDKDKAQELYENIVERGQSTINYGAIESDYSSKIVHVTHRPNHGLTHSLRASMSITALHQFDKDFEKHFKVLKKTDLEKLQLMMLFSVVGRKDETGWADTGSLKLGRKTYQSFRATSGQAYLEYCKKYALDLYNHNLDNIYRDAITVELMGYQGIEDTCKRRDASTIETFIDYVVYKELQQGRNCPRRVAVKLISSGHYTLERLFPKKEIREVADAKVSMMNKAHGIELIRCYSLYPAKKGGSSIISLLYGKLYTTGLFNSINSHDFPDARAIQQFDSFFDILRNSYDSMILTGQKTTFGMPSKELFDQEKLNLLKEIKVLFDMAKDSSKLAELRTEAIEENEKLEHYLDELSNPTKLINQLIIVKIADFFNETPRLRYDKSMFEFQTVLKPNTNETDHHLSAVKALQSLQRVSPYKGLDINESLSSPVISNVEHIRRDKTVKLTFETESHARNFLSLYRDIYEEPMDLVQKSSKQYEVTVNRKNYKQLQEMRLIEYKQVEIPEHVSREADLLDEYGVMESLNLVRNSRALIRLVSTAPLNGEAFPDYNYLFDALNDPVHERYTKKHAESAEAPIDFSRYQDPRSGRVIHRDVRTEPVPLRYQEPITKPVGFDEKIEDGWVVGNTPIKNTIFTKKMSHSLLPPHGQVIPFNGYAHTRKNYFPIGVLSNIDEVDTKDNRYVWAQNMGTVKKAWIRDTSKYNEVMYKLLKVNTDPMNRPMRSSNGVILINKSKLNLDHSDGALEMYIEKHLNKFAKKLENKFVQPSDDFLLDCYFLLKQERQIYKKHFRHDRERWKRVDNLYSQAFEQLKIEQSRKSSKYAISIRELIELQKKSTEADNHNEILASNTKTAVRALYATKDELFDRLNLALHAKQIKEKYGYDVPLIVMSQNKAPYHYTERLIQKDLREAYFRLKAGTFPFDKSESAAYELDSSGQPKIDDKGHGIKKRDIHGDVVNEMKNQAYQQQVLVDLFKLGIPELKSIIQLEEGKIDEGHNLDRQINSIVEQITTEMALIGGLSREQRYVEQVFDTNNKTEKEKVFLREASLGHSKLVDLILDKPDFVPNISLINKAIQLAEKNNHKEIQKRILYRIQNDSVDYVDEKGLKPTIRDLIVYRVFCSAAIKQLKLIDNDEANQLLSNIEKTRDKINNVLDGIGSDFDSNSQDLFDKHFEIQKDILEHLADSMVNEPYKQALNSMREKYEYTHQTLWERRSTSLITSSALSILAVAAAGLTATGVAAPIGLALATAIGITLAVASLVSWGVTLYKENQFAKVKRNLSKDIKTDVDELKKQGGNQETLDLLLKNPNSLSESRNTFFSQSNGQFSDFKKTVEKSTLDDKEEKGTESLNMD